MDLENFLSSAGSYIQDSLEKKQTEVLKNFSKQLKTASDAVVLSKLNQAQGEAYDIVYEEASRRGLV